MSARRGTTVVTGANTHRTRGASDSRRVKQRIRAYELRLDGRTLRQIGDDLGISRTTVQKLLVEEHTERLDPLKDQYLQYELDRLDRLQQIAVAMLQAPWTVHHGIGPDGVAWSLPVPDHAKLNATIATALRISESRRKLVGLDAPVKVQADVQVTETTQEDLELQELIQEAKAKADTAHAERMRMMGEQADA